jgi:hypothetical protein
VLQTAASDHSYRLETVAEMKPNERLVSTPRRADPLFLHRRRFCISILAVYTW